MILPIPQQVNLDRYYSRIGQPDFGQIDPQMWFAAMAVVTTEGPSALPPAVRPVFEQQCLANGLETDYQGL